MGSTQYQTRSAWADKFNAPTVDDLRSGVTEALVPFVELARDQLLTTPEIVEELAWKGLPWRWTLSYVSPLDSEHALAHLILEPEKPQFAMTLTAEMVGKLPMRRLKKHVRDGVLLGKQVAGIYWASWDIANKTQVLDILEVLARKHKMLVAAAAQT